MGSWTEQTAPVDSWSEYGDKTDGWTEYGALIDLWNPFIVSMSGSVSSESSVSSVGFTRGVTRYLYSNKIKSVSRVSKSYIVKTATFTTESSSSTSLSGSIVESVSLGAASTAGVSAAGAFQITNRECKGTVSAQSSASALGLNATLTLVSDNCAAQASASSKIRVVGEVEEAMHGTLTAQSSAEAIEMMATRSMAGDSSAVSTAEAIELQTTGSLQGSVSSQSSAEAIQLESSYSLAGDLTSQSSAEAIQINATRLLISDKCSASSGEDAYLTVTASSPQELKSTDSANAQSDVSGSFTLALTFISDKCAPASGVSGYLQHVGEVLLDSESDTLLDSEGRIIRTPE